MGKRGIGATKWEPTSWEEFDKLCGIQCTLGEVASYYNVSEDTIERAIKRIHDLTFAEYFAQKGKKGLISLRRKQWQVALNGDRTMLIFLGKQYLGQSDKVHFDGSGEGFEFV